uniref:Uncharacterized protein n=1 Tax=Anopheles christyi TaxID=43041 RepID=A0A182KCY5_9DIPT
MHGSDGFGPAVGTVGGGRVGGGSVGGGSVIGGWAVVGAGVGPVGGHVRPGMHGGSHGIVGSQHALPGQSHTMSMELKCKPGGQLCSHANPLLHL